MTRRFIWRPVMEMDSWQFWGMVKSNTKKNTTGLFCLGCDYDFSKKEILKRFGNMFKSCPKCGGEVRLYKKRLHKK